MSDTWQLCEAAALWSMTVGNMDADSEYYVTVKKNSATTDEEF